MAQPLLHPQLEETSTAAIVPANNPLSGVENLTDNANVWLANYSKTMTPNLVMTAGFAAQDKWQNNQNANVGVTFAGIMGGTTMPHISFNGQEAPTGFGNSNSDIVLYHVNNIGWNLFNNWMWNKGRHTFNIGGEFHHYYANDHSDYSGGQFSFSQAETSIPNTTNPNFSQYGSSFASFLLGLPDSAARTSSNTTAINTQAYSGYVQDDVKLTPKLTVNLGVRYDLMLPYTMAQNNNVFLAAGTPNPSAGNIPGAATEYGNCAGCAGYNQIAYHGLYFGPRVGFAYSLDNKHRDSGWIYHYLPGLWRRLRTGRRRVRPAQQYGRTAGRQLHPQLYRQLSRPPTASGANPTTTAVNPIPTVNPTPFSPCTGCCSNDLLSRLRA